MKAASLVLRAAFAAGCALWHPAISAFVLALMSSGIAATFAWLWYRRATPLAGGLAIGWGGVAALALASGGQGPLGMAGLILGLVAAGVHLGVIVRVGALRVAAAGMAAALLGWTGFV